LKFGKTFKVARVRINEKRIHLGYFENELEASEAYQKALNEIF